MKIKHFWNRLFGTLMLALALSTLFLALAGDDNAPTPVILCMQGMIITGGLWATKAIWE